MIKPPLTIEGRHPFFSSLSKEKLVSKWLQIGSYTLSGLQIEALYYCSLSDTALVKPGISFTKSLNSLLKRGLIEPKYSYWQLTKKGKKMVTSLIGLGLMPNGDFQPEQ